MSFCEFAQKISLLQEVRHSCRRQERENHQGHQELLEDQVVLRGQVGDRDRHCQWRRDAAAQVNITNVIYFAPTGY